MMLFLYLGLGLLCAFDVGVMASCVRLLRKPEPMKHLTTDGFYEQGLAEVERMLDAGLSDD
jgi:hypothetical protein